MFGIGPTLIGTLLYAQSYDILISTTQNNPNLRSLAISAGWDGSSAAILNFTVSATVIGSSTAGVAALDFKSSDFPSNIDLFLTVSSSTTVSGRGGGGGNGGVQTNSYVGQPGGAGSTSIKTNRSLSITNNGIIQGGGGGGGGGGGTPGATIFGTYIPPENGYAGSGGAGRDAGAAGGSGAGTGYPGTLTSGGAAMGNGGAGGNPGQSGSSGGVGPTTGGSPGAGGAGGAAGNAIEGNSYITWIVEGTRTGPIT